MKNISISKILNLTNKNKFEITCATFDAVDHIFKLDIPKSLKGRKSAIQAISLFADDQLKYGYDEYANSSLASKDENSSTTGTPEADASDVETSGTDTPDAEIPETPEEV